MITVRVLNYGELDSFPGCVKITDYAKAQGAPYFDDGTREHENCSDGWYMMSYDVDQAREYMERFTEPDDGSYTMVTGQRGNNLSIAVYDPIPILSMEQLHITLMSIKKVYVPLFA